MILSDEYGAFLLLSISEWKINIIKIFSRRFDNDDRVSTVKITSSLLLNTLQEQRNEIFKSLSVITYYFTD